MNRLPTRWSTRSALALSLCLASPVAAQDGAEQPPDAPALEAPAPAAPTAPEAPAAPATEAPVAPAADPPAADSAPIADAALTPPSLTKDVQPVYPEAAKAAGVAAEVVLEIDIDAAGRVEAARVVRPAEPAGQGFDEAAVAAANELEFEPARLGPQAVPVTIGFRFRFVPDITKPDEVTAESAVPETPPEPEVPTGELWGRLQERGSRLPLTGVKVTAFRGEGEGAEGFETETDPEGGFHFEGLRVGDWRLLADPEGYYPLRVTESVVQDERTEVRYRIEKRSYNRYDVMVETDRVRREVNRTSIDARRAERIPGTFGDVLAVVQNFPGVARANLGEIVVRGSAPEDTRVYVNGIDVPFLYHFGGLRGVLPVGMVERIDFYPGNFSVEYGRATGGVVDVDLKNLAPQRYGGYLDVNVFDSSLYVEAPVTDELALALGLRRSYIDFLIESALPTTTAKITVPRYYDMQLLASYRPDPAHRIEAFAFLSDDRFEILFNDPEPISPEFVISDVSFGQNFYRGILQYDYIPGDGFTNELKVSYGRDRSDFNVGDPLFVDAQLFQGQVRDAARYEVSDMLAVRVGLDYIVQQMDWELRLPDLPMEGGGGAGDDEDGPPDFDPDDFVFTELDDTWHSTAVFAELEVKPVESLLLVPGVRLDHFSRTGELAVSPRLTARQDVTERWALKAGVGLFVQEPQLIETDDELGNPDLDLEKAMHYSAGVEFRPRKHINLEVTGFYKTLHDLVGPTDAVGERDGETVALGLNNGAEGRVVGLEVSMRHEMADHLFGWVAYTLSRSERKDDGETQYRLFDYDQTHILTVVGSYELPRNWEISSRFRYVTGNLYTPVTGAVYDADNYTYAGIRGPTNSDRVAAFHQLDFRIDKRWIYEDWMLNAYLDIQNVYSNDNAEGLSYNYDFSETEPASGLPILPVIGLRGEL